MSRAAIFAVMAMLVGCSERPSYEQMRAVQDACHHAGMESAVRGNMISCWVSK